MSPQNILPSAATVIAHHQDADCERAGTVDPETGDCRHPDCGVGGSDPCPSCGGRRFHVDGCLDSPAPYKFFQAAGGMYLEEDPEAPQRFAVWRPVDDSFEIIGAGPTPDAALAEARAELLQEKADRDAVRKSRATSFSDGPWSATVQDDAFSYCPTITADFQDGRLWVIHLDRGEGVAIFHVDLDDEDMQEQETSRREISHAWGWSFSQVMEAIRSLCAEKALPQVSIALVARLFMAKGW